MTTFDRTYQRFREDRALLDSHGTRALKEARLAKATAYRMAKLYLSMQREDHNRLLDLIKSDVRYKDATNPIDSFLEDAFARLTTLGECYADLIRGINAGMTLAQFQATTPAVFASRKRTKERKAAQRTAAASPPPASSPTADQVRYWKERAITAEALIRDLRHRCAVLERNMARIQRFVQV